MINLFLKVDFINPQGNIALVKKLDKIKWNIEQLPTLKQGVKNQRQTNKVAISLVVASGRWIIIYRENLHDPESALLQFLDYKIDLDSFESEQIFPQDMLRAIKQIQKIFDENFQERDDTTELTYSEVFETAMSQNVFHCGDDKIVLNKAYTLGVLLEIQSLTPPETLKIAIIDEKVVEDGKTNIVLYAFINFGKNWKDVTDNGFAYLKLYDFIGNVSELDGFISAINELGGNFNRSYFIDRFSPPQLN